MTISGVNARGPRSADGRTVLPKTRPTEPDMSPSRSLRVLQYELNVVASSVLDVVSRVGGWLFDMRMAGWDVGVALAATPSGPGEHRALRVLGLKTADLTELWPAVASRGAEHVALTAIATERFENDPEVQRRLGSDGAMGDGEIAFWGHACPEIAGGRLRRTEYRPSAAARAFKAHALMAAGAGAPVSAGEVPEDAETVYCGEGALRVLATESVKC